jgi:predicted MFS family arabinose efflux permease
MPSSLAPTVAASSRNNHRAKILAMAFVAGAVVTNIYYNQPMLPLIAADLGVSQGSIGLIPGFTLAGFAFGLLTLLPLGDRFDRKRLVLIQIGLASVFALLSAAAPDLPTLLATSFGLGMVCCVPQQLVPFAAAMSPPAERGRSVGAVVGGIMIGLLLGRTVGGAVSAAAGWRAVFGMAAVFMAMIGCATAYLLPPGRPTSDLSYGRLLASLWPLVRDHGTLRRAMATQALLWVGFNAFWANLATLLAQSPWHLGSFWAGAFGLVGVVGALGATFGGRWSDRVGPRRVVLFAVATVTLAYVVMFAAQGSMLALILGVILLDLGCQSGLVSNQTLVFAIDPKAQGRINTLFMTTIFLGGACGAAVSGWLMSRYGWTGVAALGCAAGLAAGAVHASGRESRGLEFDGRAGIS